MRNKKSGGIRRRVSVLVVRGACLLCATFAVGISTGSFAEETTSPRSGRSLKFPLGPVTPTPQGDLEIEDFVATWGGAQQRITSIEAVAPGGPNRDFGARYEILIYIDAPLVSTDGLSRAIEALRRKSQKLVDLGEVSIVLANPLPGEYLAAGQNAETVRRALAQLADEPIAAGELSWIRQRFLERMGTQAGDLGPGETLLKDSVRQEITLLVQQRVELLRWLDRKAEGGPRLLVLVQDGFDLNPHSFYSSGIGESFLEDPRMQPSHREFARTIASEGWTTVLLALGRHVENVSDPLAPLAELADLTGGTVIRAPRQVAPALDYLLKSPIMTVVLETSENGQPGPVAIQFLPTKKRFESPRWVSIGPTDTRRSLRSQSPEAKDRRMQASTVPSKVIELLQPPGLSISGPTRFHVIAGHKRVESVEFWLDGELVGSDRRSPFEIVIDTGSEVSPSLIKAVAFNASGQQFGEDFVEINVLGSAPPILITEIQNHAADRELEVVAAVESKSARATRVDFYLNDVLSQSLTGPPYGIRIPYDSIGPQDIVRVTADYGPYGISEAAQLAISAGPVDQLDVNTIEILATVTSNQSSPLPRLKRDDFIVRSAGDSVPIDDFAHSDNLPLAMGLLLDTSDSMDEMITSVGEAAEKFFAQALGPDDVAFVVDFDTRPRLVHHSTGDTETLLRSIRSLRARGNTALYDSIAFSLQQFDAKARRKALVVVTDGLDSTSRLQPKRCIEQARYYGVPIYLIVLGEPPSKLDRPQVLLTEAIARRSGGRTYYLTNLDGLDRVYAQIGAELRSQYFLAVTTDRTLTPKELEKLEVKVLRKNLAVRTLLASQQHGS